MVELADLEARSFESPALSLYLTVGAGAPAPERFLDPLLRELRDAGADGGERAFAEALSGEIKAAERELAGSARSRTVALFSCGPADLLEVFELPEEVPPMMVFADRLETWPLREQLRQHPERVVHRKRRRRPPR